MKYEDNPNYLELRRAISERPGDFVAIVGAGLSAQSGLPTWKQLTSMLIQHAENYCVDLVACGTPPDIQLNFEKLSNENDLWKVMKVIKSCLPKSDFEAAVKKHLQHNCPPRPPVTLVNLWRLGIKGIVTPNLDPLAVDAYANCFSRGVDVSDASTRRYMEFLGDERHFVFQPHGTLGNSDSWVLTPDELSTIITDASYRQWWDRLLSSRNLLFLGINESDTSIKTYILNNSSKRRHFVVAPTDAGKRMTLLQEIEFLHVPYEVFRNESLGTEDHSQLAELIESIVDIQPKELIPPAAFQGSVRSISELPTPEEMLKLPIDRARELLNSAVASILSNDGDAKDESLEAFNGIRKRYLPLFSSLGAVEPDSQYDTLYGYRVVDVIGEGAFGRVYRATRLGDMSTFSIKIIHSQMLSSGDHLNAFRRGAYAMRLLSKRRIEGMVAFEEAFEVPFSIVMEFIDGQDLEHAIESRLLRSLLKKLQVMRRVAEIVHSAHSTREQVLHRDLKPGNILLNGYSYEDEEPLAYVKVVDFDLCWHKYATAQTIVHHKGSRGYAAPEMFDHSLGSSRRASVDVFGLGMLLYFVLTGNHPIPGMTERPSFESSLAADIRRLYRSNWTALGWHLARAVRVCTESTPSRRCTVPDFIAMLDTSISLESKDSPEMYLPIIGIQLLEDVIPGITDIEYQDFGRTLIFSRGNKSLRLSLSARGTNITARFTIRITKDEALGGAGHPRRDAKVEERIKKIAMTEGYEFFWVANRSMREATVSGILPKISSQNVRNLSGVIRQAWEEIERNQ